MQDILKRRQADQLGFTLVEILTVMAIIGILMAIGLTNFQSSQKKGRDTRRKSDLEQVTRSLEAYYNDKGQYPQSSGSNQILGCANEAQCNWGEVFQDENDTIYMVKLPEDPKPTQAYNYESDGTYYKIYARLENELDGSIQSLSTNCGSGVTCNYGVASSNATL